MMTPNRCATHLTRLAVAALVAGGVSLAQVVAPAEIKDVKLRALQSKHQAELTAAAQEMEAHKYPAKFYLTKELDLRGGALFSADRRSIEFSTYGTQTVLRIRANYAAVYPTETPAKDRVSRTYLDVVVPVLTEAMKNVHDETEMDAVDIEISHHVRKITVITVDRFENSAFVVPHAVARRIAGAADPEQQLAALKDATVYIDGKVVPFNGQAPVPAPVTISQRPAVPTPAPVVEPPPPPKKEVLEQRQTGLQPMLDRMVQELGSQAHFDPLAKPELAAFRGASYLRVPVVTTLTAADGGSQYRVAALAFDRHVSHLVRLALPYVKSASGFDGIAFRTTVTAGASPAESVEFLFPLAELRRYENYDITGQQLINAGFVLINGERVGLDLQTAETVKP
jgi:hypothetical protein